MGSITSRRTPPGLRPTAKLFAPPPKPPVIDAPSAGPATPAMPSAAEARAALDASRGGGMPTRENRPVENFNTVADELAKTMSISPRDNKSPAVFSRLAESMRQIVRESLKNPSPDDSFDLEMAAGAYQQAFQNLDPASQRAILAHVDNLFDSELKAAGDRLSPQDRKAFQIERDVVKGAFTSRSPVMDQPPATDPTMRQARDAVMLDTTGGQGREVDAARDMLRRVMREGVPASELNQATVADAFVDPFNAEQRGIYDYRDNFPEDWRLSSLIDSENAKRLRPASGINEKNLAQEMMGEYAAITNRQDRGIPTLPPVIGDVGGYNPDVIRGGSVVGEGYDAQLRERELDRMVARQMQPSDDSIREELFQRAFGMPDRVMGDDVDPSTFQRQTPLNLDFVAPYHRGLVQDVVDGQVITRPMTPEEVTKTMFSQNMFLAEAPELRAAAYQKLLPQVEEAMMASLDTKPQYRAVREAGTVYPPGTANRRLLDGLRTQPAPSSPPKVDTEGMRERMQKAIRALKPRESDTGFVQPMGVNSDMMNNRLLSGLMA